MNDATNETETLLNIDEILDQSMENIEEAAGFVTPSDGLYVVGLASCKIEKHKTKDDPTKEKHRIKYMYQISECLEKSNSEDDDTPANGLFTEIFQLNEQGLSYFKQKATRILGDTAGLTLGETIKSLNESEAVLKVSTRLKKTPKEGGGEYINVQVKVLERQDVELPGFEKAAE